MKVVDFLAEESINLDLQATTKDEVLGELVERLELDEKNAAVVLRMLKKREHMGSTGMGRGVAIPHGRSLVISRLMVAVGRSTGGIEFNAMDGKPVHLFFLIVAPPQEISNIYLPTLGRIAQFLKDPENREALQTAESASAFRELMARIEG
ncbi:MAG: PTS fructose transporter subunit IIA [Gemmatimonadetes bacterium]|nr:PTS fructose transporter subunit IIA [Gemmatimonadota bacterium]